MDWAILGTVIGIGAVLLGAIVTVLVLAWNMKGDIGILLDRTEDLLLKPSREPVMRNIVC